MSKPDVAGSEARGPHRPKSVPGRCERRHLPYTPQQLFDLVADVERYPDFLPWMVAAHIRRREGDTMWVDMVIGTTLLRRELHSRAELERPTRITISSHDALFDRYEQSWRFKPAEDGGTIVEHCVDFEFHSSVLQAMMGPLLEEVATTMVGAFKRRARQAYGADGRPSAKSSAAGS